jgi:hypothetical protein
VDREMAEMKEDLKKGRVSRTRGETVARTRYGKTSRTLETRLARFGVICTHTEQQVLNYAAEYSNRTVIKSPGGIHCFSCHCRFLQRAEKYLVS